MKKWYVAVLIVRCRVDDEAGTVGPWTVDEQIRVIRATDEDDAYEHAIQLGKGEEVSYPNAYGNMVHWEFLGLAHLQELDATSIRNGTEIHSRLTSKTEPANLVRDKERLEVYEYQQNRLKNARDVTEQ